MVLSAIYCAPISMRHLRLPETWVVLDRDGVINQDSDDYVKSVDEWIPIDSSIDAIAKLQACGYAVAVVTNQSGVGRGYYGIAELNAMHAKLNQLLLQAGGTPIEHILYCPHSPEANCDCRKPLPGLLDQLVSISGASLAGGYVVGDSLRDLEAGIQREMQPILVRTGKGRLTESKPLPAHTRVFDDLAQFVDYLCD